LRAGDRHAPACSERAAEVRGSAGFANAISVPCIRLVPDQKKESGLTRIAWIDILKGIGILSVVAAHLYGNSFAVYCNWFHIPLFFYISGFLYGGDRPVPEYLRRKAAHLLVPYFSFLLILSLPDFARLLEQSASASGPALLRDAGAVLAKKLWGGRDLYYWFDAFWFPPCLFLTQQLFHAIHHICKEEKRTIIIATAGCYLLAMTAPWNPVLATSLPWSAQCVPMGFVFFALGYLLKDRQWDNRIVAGFSCVLAIAAIILDRWGIFHHAFNMKWSLYGIPVINLLIAMGMIGVVQRSSKELARFSPGVLLLSPLGKASLVIMLLHQAVLYSAMDRWRVIGHTSIFAFVVVFCYVVYRISRGWAVTRVAFFGVNSRQ